MPDIGKALVFNPTNTFNTFIKGVSQGFDTFVTRMPARLPGIVANWLLPNSGLPTENLQGSQVVGALISKAGFDTDDMWGRFASHPNIAGNLALVMRAEKFFDKDLSSILDEGTSGDLFNQIASPLQDSLQNDLIKSIPSTLLRISAK